MTGLFPIERAAVEAIANEYPELAAAIHHQLRLLRVRERTNTGAGFYADFTIESSAQAIPAQSPIGEPFAVVEGLEHGMGFLLALKDGKIDYLEGYSFEVAAEPLDFETVRFEMKPRPLQ